MLHFISIHFHFGNHRPIPCNFGKSLYTFAVANTYANVMKYETYKYLLISHHQACLFGPDPRRPTTLMCFVAPRHTLTLYLHIPSIASPTVTSCVTNSHQLCHRQSPAVSPTVTSCVTHSHQLCHPQSPAVSPTVTNCVTNSHQLCHPQSPAASPTCHHLSPMAYDSQSPDT